MKTAWIRALELILSGNAELLNILSTTGRMCLMSSVISLAIGLPIGIMLGTFRFPGRKVLLLINRTLMGMPPVVCGLIFYLLFSGVGPFGKLHWIFTVRLMVIAQVALITPLVVSNTESFVKNVAPPVRETAAGLGLKKGTTAWLLARECGYEILFTYLLAFSRSMAEVGAISMVGGAIAWKTNVMTTAIMMYTNRGDFTLGIALGIILIGLYLIVNVLLALLERRVRK